MTEMSTHFAGHLLGERGLMISETRDIRLAANPKFIKNSSQELPIAAGSGYIGFQPCDKTSIGFTTQNGHGDIVKLAEIADKLDREGIFTGGAPHLFESAGRLQLSTLVREGLYPSSRLLDVGCGCLRAGYWLIRLLDRGCYFGIEPNAQMLEAGIQYVLGPELQAAKRPSLDTNDRFDFSVFGVQFDAFLARSIWTHSSKAQIQTMLDGFVQNSSPDAFFLTSYYPASWFGRGAADYTGTTADYTGTSWIGRSHTSAKPGMVCHKRSWIEAECRARGLQVLQLSDPPFNGQYWLKISRKPQETAQRRKNSFAKVCFSAISERL